MNLPWWISLLKALLCLLWSTAGVLLVRLGIQRIHTLWLRVRDFFGTGTGRSMALLCTAVLFTSSVPDFIEVPLRLVYGSLFSIPLQANESVPDELLDLTQGDFASQGTALQEVNRTARLLAAGLMKELQLFQQHLPYVQLVAFFIVWLVLGRVFQALLKVNDSSQSEGDRSLLQLVQGNKRWMLVFLLVTGLSLCVASITAVSELNDKQISDNPALSLEKLRARLEESKDLFKDHKDYPHNTAENDVLSMLDKELQEQQGSPESPPDDASRSRLAAARAQVGLIEAEREQLRGIWDNLLSAAGGRYARATADAETEYEVNSTTLHGVREQRQQFLDIIAWHRQARHTLRTSIESCKRQIIITEMAWAAWASDVQLRLRTGKELLSKSAALQNLMREAQESCQLAELKPVPPREAFGEALGLLKPIAGWLLRSESVQLALIIGMLGAGLLGSAVASFLRSHSAQAHTDGQLMGVIVRGVTAAIVVFLAVQGGLSTVSGPSGSAPPSPNPYLLLLICFVAAVYSEQVWSAAQRRLAGQLGFNERGAQSDATEARPVPKPDTLAGEGAQVRAGT